MSKRFRDTRLTHEVWFRKLTPAHKCAWSYILDVCDQVGVWTIDQEAMNFFVGAEINVDEFLLMVNKDKVRIERFDSDKLLVLDFISFQYGNLSEHSPAHKPIFLLIQKYNLVDRLGDRLSNSLQEKEKEKEMEKEEEKDIKNSEKKPKKPKSGKASGRADTKPKGSQPASDEFKAPTVEEVIAFFIEKGGTEEQARRAYDYYSAGEWHDKNGNQVRNWKQKMVSWINRENKFLTKTSRYGTTGNGKSQRPEEYIPAAPGF